MRSRLYRLIVAGVAIALVMAVPGLASAQPPKFRPHLMTVGFDTLGEPGNGLNSEIVVDIESKFAYVGSITFDPDEPDRAVKAVDLSDPTDPTVTADVTVSGDWGPFDVKIAGNILAASSQGPLDSNPGVTLMDITDRSQPVPVSIICAPGCVSELPKLDVLESKSGSHNSFLWADLETGKTWLFVTGIGGTSLQIFDVTMPAAPMLVAEYDNREGEKGSPYVHDNFVQEINGRVLEYQAGVKGVEILDVTKVVRGGFVGTLTFKDDVVGFNHYTSNPEHAALVTRPGFAHYIQPTASGGVTWVGDEAGCGEPAIARSLDSSGLPDPPGKKFLSELGTIIQDPDPMAQCAGLIHGQNENAIVSQSNVYRFTGHNFDIWGEELLIRGDYGRGVSVYDITDPTDPVRVAFSQGLALGVGAENKEDPGRDNFLDNTPWVWQAIYDGDLIYASDIVQGIYVLDLIGD
jgi:hypothetical protein